MKKRDSILSPAPPATSEFTLPDPRQVLWPDWTEAAYKIGSLVEVGDVLGYQKNGQVDQRYSKDTGLVIGFELRDWVQQNQRKTFAFHQILLLRQKKKIWTLTPLKVIQEP